MDDLADAAVYLMENYDNNDKGEFINIGTGEDVTIRELGVDVSGIKSLGWKAKISLEEGIQRTYQNYLNKISD